LITSDTIVNPVFLSVRFLFSFVVFPVSSVVLGDITLKNPLLSIVVSKLSFKYRVGSLLKLPLLIKRLNVSSKLSDTKKTLFIDADCALNVPPLILIPDTAVFVPFPAAIYS